ncbi:MAG: type IV-A pilus assembly ATPase PilB [Acidobacteriota bacterium]|nr:type IV-A pilus assembly ATPase PilB [Acidobacteriota bacterium]
MAVNLGDLLVRENLISRQQLRQALAYQKVHGGRLGHCLIRLGWVTGEDISAILCRQFGLPSINLPFFKVDPSAVKLIPPETARKYQVLPLSREGTTLTVATIDPTDVPAMDDLQFMTGFTIEPVVAAESAVRGAIRKHYGPGPTLELKQAGAGGTVESGPGVRDEPERDRAGQAPVAMEDPGQTAGEAPVVQLVNRILSSALKQGASDIHIEPYEQELRVRFRIDGLLSTVMTPPLSQKDAVTSRIKIMAKLDISEKRLPQDGRMKIRLTNEGRAGDLDLRVSVLPTLHGEKVVLRLLDRDRLMLDMTQLGFEPDSLRRFESAILKPYGMVLVTGPTGSGKTSTLYSSITRLNRMETNILTAEDPVEFNLTGINQLQVKEQIGLTFATALRAFLRQDPNIVLVGEMRDLETAEIAIKAALTGHLVLSTLHTNDAASTVIRLTNMGVEPFLVASSVHLICAQRLVRRICRQCRQAAQPPVESLIEAGFSPSEAPAVLTYRGRGCDACNHTGYKGRVGLFEVMEIGDGLRELILRGGSSAQLKQTAIQDGMITLRASGLQKIRDGVTTLEEILRETAR